MNRQLLVKNLNGFPQISNIFLQFLMIILKMMLLNIAFEVMLAESNFQSFSFLFNDYKKTWLRLFRSSFFNNVCWSNGFVQGLLHRHLKGMKDNHNTLLELTFFFTRINFKVTLSVFS